MLNRVMFTRPFCEAIGEGKAEAIRLVLRADAGKGGMYTYVGYTNCKSGEPCIAVRWNNLNSVMVYEGVAAIDALASHRMQQAADGLLAVFVGGEEAIDSDASKAQGEGGEAQRDG